MKKMRFTLGLMLSMLILGANVANAQFNYGLSSNANIAVTITVHPCGFYADNVEIGTVYYDPILPNYPSYDPIVDPYGVFTSRFIYDRLETKTVTSTPFTIPYGANSSTNRDWIYNSSNILTSVNAGGNLLYWKEKGQAKVYNDIYIALDYTEGNELKPAVFRTITLGEWRTQSSRNVVVPVTTKKIYSQLNPERDPNYVHFRPIMDRKTNTAEYFLRDDILSLLNNYIIYSIEYEVVIHDEVDYNMGLDPLGTLPHNKMGVQLNPEVGDGIFTFPNHLSGSGPDRLYFVPVDNWTFTAFSKTPLTKENVTLEPLYESDAYKTIPDVDKAVIVTDIGDGLYDITIRKILFNYKIGISSATSTSGEGDGDQTGNLALGKNFAYAALGTLYVQTDSPATLSIYSVTGQLVKQMQVTGNTSLPLPKGLYIVQLNGKAYKVIN